jgi:hypothetical protein
MSRRVIVIKSPDRHLFDEAIFIVREDAVREGGVTGDDIIRQAQEVADHYVRYRIKKSLLARLPAPAFTALGAGLTALAWLLSLYVF